MTDSKDVTVNGGQNFLSVIERIASNPDADVDKLEKMLDMQERMLAKQAKSDFSEAMTAAQSELGRIQANKANKQTHSIYADYAALDKVVRPVYTKHGFALSFDTGETEKPETVRVLCHVSHRGGHTHTYHVDVPADGKGAKGGDVMTKTHATGSGLSYGRRYLLLLIFNLAVGDEDDDGNTAGGSNLVQELLDYNELVRDCWPTIYHVKNYLIPQWGETEAERNIDAARECYKELSEAEQRALWRAPAKGGIFTTEERALLKGTHQSQQTGERGDRG